MNALPLRLLSAGAPVAFVLLWAGGFIVAAFALRDSGPLTLLCLRYGGVVFALLLAIAFVRPPVPRQRRRWIVWIGGGFLLHAAYFPLSYSAMALGVPVGIASLVVNQQPILVALVAASMTSERVSPRTWIGLLVGVLGGTMVIVANPIEWSAIDAGLILSVLALVCISANQLLENRFGTDGDFLLASLVQYGIGFAVSAPLASFVEGFAFVPTVSLAVSLVYLVFANSLLAIGLLLFLLRQGKASSVSAMFFMVPPATAALGFLFLGETLGALAIAGMLLSATGIALVLHEACELDGPARGRPLRS